MRVRVGAGQGEGEGGSRASIMWRVAMVCNGVLHSVHSVECVYFWLGDEEMRRW